MTDIVGSSNKIQVEACDHNSPLSEDLLTKIGAGINYIIDNSTHIIGDIISSALTEAQFQAIRGNNWVRMNGQSIAGSDFSTLTGITTLPSIIDGGALISANDSSITATSSGENKSHRHRGYSETLSSGSGVVATVWADSGTGGSLGYMDTTSYGTPIIENSGGANNLSAGVRVNFFIKINNEPT